MKTLFPLSPRQHGRHRPNGIFLPEDNLSDFSSTTTSSDEDEDSSNDWVDPLWVPDENVQQYPSSATAGHFPLAKSAVCVLQRKPHKEIDNLTVSMDNIRSLRSDESSSPRKDKSPREVKDSKSPRTKNQTTNTDSNNGPTPTITISRTTSSPTNMSERKEGKSSSPLRRRNSTLSSRRHKRRVYMRDRSPSVTTSTPSSTQAFEDHMYEGIRLSGEGAISRANGRRLSSLLTSSSENVPLHPSTTQRRHASLCLTNPHDYNHKSCGSVRVGGGRSWLDEEEEEIDTPHTPIKEKVRRLSVVGKKESNVRNLPSLSLPIYNSSNDTAPSSKLATTSEINCDKENRENGATFAKPQQQRRRDWEETAKNIKRNSKKASDWKEKRKGQSYDKLVPMLAFELLQKKSEEEEDGGSGGGGGEDEGEEVSPRRPQSARERTLRKILFKKNSLHSSDV